MRAQHDEQRGEERSRQHSVYRQARALLLREPRESGCAFRDGNLHGEHGASQRWMGGGRTKRRSACHQAQGCAVTHTLRAGDHTAVRNVRSIRTLIEQF
ncbi:hypothetical protein NFJ02_05g123740 [Pycnococcus provasolii]